jgi:hypothetical protein
VSLLQLLRLLLMALVHRLLVEKLFVIRDGRLQGLSTFAKSKLPRAVTTLRFGAHTGVRIFVSN